MSSISELENLQPRFLQNRFRALNNYAWDNLFPNAKQDYIFKRKGAKTKREKANLIKAFKRLSDEAAFVIYIYVLIRFFKSGTEAAREAVDLFKEFNIDSFNIGSKEFKDRNENVEAGEKLATELIEKIKDKELKELILKSKAVHEIIDKYKKIIDNLSFLNVG